MDDTMLAFTAIGGILVIGFIGELILKKYKISPALILLGIGYLLGPGSGFLDIDLLRGMQNLIGPLALIILLFDSGTRMNIQKVFREGVRGLGMGLLVSILIILLVASLWAFLYGNFFVGILLGAVFAGGATSAMAGPLAERMKLDEETNTFFEIECAASDVFSVVLVITLTASIVSGVFDAVGIAGEIVNEFVIAAIIGAIMGAAWILISVFGRGTGFFHMLTFAAALLTYVVVLLFGGDGLIGVLIFGIMVGNMGEFGKMTGISSLKRDDEMLKFQEEISFMVRTFFFVFLGALMSFGNLKAIAVGVAIVLIIFLARNVAVSLMTRGNRVLERDAHKLSAIVPRGFEAAVMAIYPAGAIVASAALMQPEYYESIMSQVGIFPEITFVVIVVSILFTTVESFIRTKEDEVKPSVNYDAEKELSGEVAASARFAKEKRAKKKNNEVEEVGEDILEDEAKGKV
jgi:cell volume regulation protein A